MMGRKICFHGEMWVIIPKLSLLPLLICTTVVLTLLNSELPNLYVVFAILSAIGLRGCLFYLSSYLFEVL